MATEAQKGTFAVKVGLAQDVTHLPISPRRLSGPKGFTALPGKWCRRSGEAGAEVDARKGAATPASTPGCPVNRSIPRAHELIVPAPVS
jgi:hypothetical protein